MFRHRAVILSLALLIPLLGTPSAPSLAQDSSSYVRTAPSATPAPGRIQKLKERTKESWAQMKHRWSMQREKWTSCRDAARKQRLAGRKTRQFLEDCMNH